MTQGCAQSSQGYAKWWACALAAQADLIVSGDQDLLVLQAFEGIPIVTAAQALQRLQASNS